MISELHMTSERIEVTTHSDTNRLFMAGPQRVNIRAVGVGELRINR